MGCCFTKPVRHNHPQNGGPTTPHPHRHHNTPTQESCRATVADRAPPPSVEVEYVKEVLSETHLPNIQPEASAAVVSEKKPLAGEEKMEAEEEVEKVVEEVSASEILEMSEVSQSQVSEMCSASESYSTATTFTDKRDDEVVSKPSAGERVTRSPVKPPRKRPHSGEVSGARERFAKSPVRRVQPSLGAARTSRGAAQSRIRQQNAGVRRDPGESSGRRSRSPVTRGAGGAGRGSMGRSPMKKPVKPGGRSENGGVAAESQSQKQSKEEEEHSNGVVPQQGNESLENPHVSMECFIFL